MKKLNTKGFSIVETFIVIIVLGLIGGAAWYVSQNKDNDVAHKTQQPTNLSNKELVAKIKDRIAHEVPAVKVIGADEGGYNGQVSFKTDGYDFLAIVEGEAYVNYQPKDAAMPKVQHESEEAAAKQKDTQVLEPARAIILQLLQQNGFGEVTDYPTTEIAGEAGKMYARSGDVCAVNTGTQAGISCASKAVLAKEAAKIKPFVEAYRNSKAEKPEATSFGLLETGTGTTKDDKYAVISAGPAGAFFYQKNGQWVYLRSSQEGIDCTDTEQDPAAARAFSKTCIKSGEGL